MNAKQLIIVLVGLSASASTFAESLTKLALLGDPISVSAATRTIVIAPDTKYVNVTGGETVKFLVGDKSFAWRFDGPFSSFNLARIAPPSVLYHKVVAYVAPNPLYLMP